MGNSMNEQLDKIIDFCFRGDVSWTIDQLEGTSYHNSAMAEIEENKKKAKAKLQRLIVEAMISGLSDLARNCNYASGAKKVDYVPVWRIESKIEVLTKELENE